MRRILVDHARRQSAARRGGGAHRIDLEEPLLVCSEKMEIVLDIDWALGKLEQLDPRQAHVVVFRFFGGLSEEEIASVLGVSARTVKRDWRMARAWLHGILARNPSRTDA
jgi:RNA polymerase sigma factor (TIGR02999 family)